MMHWQLHKEPLTLDDVSTVARGRMTLDGVSIIA